MEKKLDLFDPDLLGISFCPVLNSNFRASMLKVLLAFYELDACEAIMQHVFDRLYGPIIYNLKGIK